MRRAITYLVALFIFFSINAQERSNVNLEISIGVLDLSESESFGLFLNLEPKLKSSENTCIGLRLGVTLNSQTIANSDSLLYDIDEKSDNGVVSILPTIDYTFDESKLHPSMGIGLGCYLLGGYVDVLETETRNAPVKEHEIRVNYKLGVLLRGGIDLGSSRLGLEYNLVPRADIELPDGHAIGTVGFSYLGLSIGFVIGA